MNNLTISYQHPFYFVPLDEEPAGMTAEQRELWLKAQAEKGADKLVEALYGENPLGFVSKEQRDNG